jgi:hypothetical protein
LNLAVVALGGGEQLLEALREAVREAGVLQADLPGGPGPDALRAAAWRLAGGTTDAGQLAKLLGCTALLRSALADFLVQEADSENTWTIMKEVRSVAKAEVVPTQTVEVPRLHARYEHAWLTTL